MNMKKLLLASTVCLMFFAPNAHACSQLPPETAFVMSNDKNQDNQLSSKEWRNAQIDQYFVAFRLGNMTEFKRLDKNKNGLLNHKELSDKVRYQQEHCANWEKNMQKIISQEQNNQK